MKYFNSLLISLIFLTSCSQSKSKGITEVSQNELNTGIVIDVRTPEEYSGGHLDQALNINWYDADFIQQFDTIHKNKTIYVYCKKGGRSAKAAHVLDSLGFSKVVNLEGGYDRFLEAKHD